MKCRKPYGYLGCGQCLPCRINRRNLWTGRMMLELGCHPVSCFVTWTYKEMPDVMDMEKLYRVDVQRCYKRLAYYAGPFRHYTVGEFGTKNGRPHWHAGIFGLGFDQRALFAKAWRGHLASEVSEVPEDSFGGVHVGELNHDSAQYLLKYVCKPWERNCVRMSRNPGIGVPAIQRGVLGLEGSDAAVTRLLSVGDVPSEIRQEKKRYPLGRHLRGKIRESLGLAVGVPKELRVQFMQERAAETPDSRIARIKAREAAALNAEGRLRIRNSRRKL